MMHTTKCLFFQEIFSFHFNFHSVSYVADKSIVNLKTDFYALKILKKINITLFIVNIFCFLFVCLYLSY